VKIYLAINGLRAEQYTSDEGRSWWVWPDVNGDGWYASHTPPELDQPVTVWMLDKAKLLTTLGLRDNTLKN
jgi:hypothetical protein